MIRGIIKEKHTRDVQGKKYMKSTSYDGASLGHQS